MTDKQCETKCPVSHVSSILCAIEKILKIIVFIALAMVLFDVHGMLKAQKEYANAVTAAVAAQSGMNDGGNAVIATKHSTKK